MKNEKSLVLFYLPILALPVLTNTALLLMNSMGFHFEALIPSANDELQWWQLVNDFLRYGGTLGNIGYNGSYARIGSFGPWGLAPLLPYALFGKVFGWELNSMCIANMVFLSVSLYFFCVLAKPDRKQLKWVVIMYLCSFITIRYSLSSMSEGLRYSTGIILTGTALWLKRNQIDIRKAGKKKIILFFGIIVYLFFAINIYLIFALMAWVIIWLILYGLKPFARGVICFIGTFLLAAVSYIIVQNTSAPYFYSTPGNVLKVFETEGIFPGVSFLVDTFFKNLETVSLFELLRQSSNILQWYFLEYILVMVALAVKILGWISPNADLGKRNCFVQARLENYFLAFFLMSGFLVSYCALKSNYDWDLCRGTNTAMLMALLLIAMEPRRFDGKAVYDMKLVVLIITVLGISPIWSCYGKMLEDKSRNINIIEEIIDEKKKLENIIYISQDNDKWENTVAQYGFYDRYYLSLPNGTGLNMMRGFVLNENARYAMFRTDDPEEDREIWHEMLSESGHELIFQDDIFFVYKKRE